MIPNETMERARDALGFGLTLQPAAQRATGGYFGVVLALTAKGEHALTVWQCVHFHAEPVDATKCGDAVVAAIRGRYGRVPA